LYFIIRIYHDARSAECQIDTVRLVGALVHWIHWQKWLFTSLMCNG